MSDRRHPLRQAFVGLVWVATWLAAVEIPVRLSLGTVLTSSGVVFEAVLSLVFIADIVLRWFPPHVDGRKRQLARARYVRSWLLVDVLSALPFAAVFAVVVPDAPTSHPVWWALLLVLRFLRVLRLVNVGSVVRGVQRVNPALVRLLLFAFWIGLTAHWMACGWLALGGIAGDLDAFSRYIRALYWVVTTLTTVGYGDISPSTNVQIIFTMGVEVVGVGIYGYIIGNVASLLANLDVERARQAEKMQQVQAFLQSRQLPPELAERIRSFYGHLFETRALGIDERVLDDLPRSLRTEVALHLNRDLLTKVPLFQDAEPNLISDLALALRPEVHPPGSVVIEKGRVGDRMYFVATGELHVVDDNHALVATLREGDFFGEMALLRSQRRSASILAASYCHLYMLSRDVFEDVTREHPLFAARLDDIAAEREQELSGEFVIAPDGELHDV